MKNVEVTVEEIIECARFLISTIKPSEWAEQNRLMTSDISPLPGMLSYDNSPYTREIVDCFAPDHPARIIAVMKGAQIGFSTTVIEAAIGWIISQCPGNILFLVGHEELVEEAIAKVDRMIDNSGIRNLIKPNINRRKNMKTGDTNRKKEFPGGSLISGHPSNHKLLRNRSMQYGFIDDFEAAKSVTEQSGSTRKMIEQRFAAYAKKMKLAYISTPEIKQTSNIEPVFLMGDQRYYHIYCPCCSQPIPLLWEVTSEKNQNNKAGITWQLDDNLQLIPGSVGYICQKCEGFFDDKNKNELLKKGFWKPTAEPSQPGYYSYHISSLYAPTYMYDWEHYVREYLIACPPGQAKNESEWKAFKNLVLGETYEAEGETPKGTDLQNNNARPYEIGIVPERLSERDGNGKIILLTCACDLNGIVDDARLDYEIVAWAMSGACYSITHGSIGTFKPGDTKRADEKSDKWTYKLYQANSVWNELDKILDKTYMTDTNRQIKIFLTGVDTGHYGDYAWQYMDKSNNVLVGLKGNKKDKYTPLGKDEKSFKFSVEKKNLYLVNHNYVKDKLSAAIKLKWNEQYDKIQPAGFLNFPFPDKEKYQYKTYFSHWESEHRVIKESKDGTGVGIIWEKKNSASQNHFWDVRVYNIVVKDIFVALFGKENKIQNPDWQDWVNFIVAATGG